AAAARSRAPPARGRAGRDRWRGIDRSRRRRPASSPRAAAASRRRWCAASARPARARAGRPAPARRADARRWSRTRRWSARGGAGSCEAPVDDERDPAIAEPRYLRDRREIAGHLQDDVERRRRERDLDRAFIDANHAAPEDELPQHPLLAGVPEPR